MGEFVRPPLCVKVEREWAMLCVRAFQNLWLDLESLLSAISRSYTEKKCTQKRHRPLCALSSRPIVKGLHGRCKSEHEPTAADGPE